MADKIHPSSTHDESEISYCFHCPGCEHSHPVRVKSTNPAERYCWQWNGSLEAPTFKPSLLVYESIHYPRCHSFITDGRIQFLPDCGHALAGQTVEIPDWENEAFAD